MHEMSIAAAVLVVSMAVAAGQWRKRSAYGIADAFLQQDRKAGGGGHDTLRAHAGFRQAQVQRVIAAGGQRAIHVHQILHAADFGAENDPVVRQAVALRGRCRFHAGSARLAAGGRSDAREGAGPRT